MTRLPRTTPSSMNASRPITHSAPIRAPFRTWARCQMLVPGPTSTSASRSADGCTRAVGSITSGGSSCSEPVPDGAAPTDWSTDGPSIPECQPAARRSAATGESAPTQDRAAAAEGERAAPVDERLDVAFDPGREDDPGTRVRPELDPVGDQRRARRPARTGRRGRSPRRRGPGGRRARRLIAAPTPPSSTETWLGADGADPALADRSPRPRSARRSRPAGSRIGQLPMVGWRGCRRLAVATAVDRGGRRAPWCRRPLSRRIARRRGGGHGRRRVARGAGAGPGRVGLLGARSRRVGPGASIRQTWRLSGCVRPSRPRVRAGSRRGERPAAPNRSIGYSPRRDQSGPPIVRHVGLAVHAWRCWPPAWSCWPPALPRPGTERIGLLGEVASPSASAAPSARPSTGPSAPRRRHRPRRPSPVADAGPEPTLVADPLTGEMVTPAAAALHPIAVMIDDLSPARPQSGLS